MELPLMNGGSTLIDSEDLVLLDGWRLRRGSKDPYAFATAYNLIVPLARLILGLQPGDGLIADHIDPARTFDNRRANLRIVDQSQSQWNTRIRKNNTSGHKGVSWHKGREIWQAGLYYHGKNIFLGRFKELEDAKQAYADGAKKFFGEFARLG